MDDVVSTQRALKFVRLHKTLRWLNRLEAKRSRDAERARRVSLVIQALQEQRRGSH